MISRTCMSMQANRSNSKLYSKYLKCVKTPVVISTGPAGTGKTMFACKHSLEHLVDKNYEKMIITRPNVSVDEDLGYLPGEIMNKMYPWLIPMYDQLEKFSNKALIGKYLKEGTIEVAPLGFIRGRTFENTIVLADEMQNSTPNQMITLLTRIGENSKLIITGDLDQCDIFPAKNGLEDLIQKININESIDEIKTITFTEDDIKRSEIVKKILGMYKL